MSEGEQNQPAASRRAGPVFETILIFLLLAAYPTIWIITGEIRAPARGPQKALLRLKDQPQLFWFWITLVVIFIITVCGLIYAINRAKKE
jgi:hypothetical protein